MGGAMQQNGLLPLRPLQQRAIDGLRESLGRGGKRPIIAAPTGFGKTVLSAHIVQGALNKGKRVAFVVPKLTLIDQTLDRFGQNGIDLRDMGVMQGDHPLNRCQAPVQICSVQTIASRGFPTVDFVIIDEVHKQFKVIEQWIKEQPNKIFVGLSATPWSKGLADYFDDLIIPTSIGELIEIGDLCKFKVYAPSHPDLTGVKTVAGDYHEGQLSERMSGKAIVGDVVRTWLDKAGRQPTLVFAVDRAHAKLLYDQFAEEGVACAYVDALTPREERYELGRQLNQGHIEVICSVGTMTEGVDLDIRCIVLARPTKSEMLFVQMIGRGLRTAPGKEQLVVFDHSDTHLRLGMVTDIHHDKLLSGKKDAPAPVEAKPKVPVECPSCKALVAKIMLECPHCGVKLRQPGIEIVSGELSEMDDLPSVDELTERELARKLKRKTNGELTWEEKAWFLGELRRYARERGYKDGWASNKYKEKTGVWPNDPRVKYAIMRNCGYATRSWIKSSQIKWANSREKRSTDEIIHDSVRELVP